MKKGFTLIELLAVIIILAALVLLVSRVVTKSLKTSKEQLYDSQISSIIASTEMWIADNIENINTGCTYITLQTLQTGGYIGSVKNPKTDANFVSNSTYIKITVTGTTNLVFNYEVVFEVPSSCTLFNQA